MKNWHYCYITAWLDAPKLFKEKIVTAMKSLLQLVFLMVLISPRAECSGVGEISADLSEVIRITNEVGLIAQSSFYTYQPSEEEIREFKKSIEASLSISESVVLDESLFTKSPAYIGHHQSSGFRVNAYLNEDEISLLFVWIPLVNASGSDGDLMLENMFRIAGSLSENQKKIEKWAKKQTEKACEAYLKYSESGNEKHKRQVVRKLQKDGYTYSLWCVVPDLVVFTAIKSTNLD